jgi:hypothetical protein
VKPNSIGGNETIIQGIDPPNEISESILEPFLKIWINYPSVNFPQIFRPSSCSGMY